MDIVLMVLDLMHDNFHCQIVNEVEMLLLLDLIIVHPCMLIIERKIFISW